MSHAPQVLLSELNPAWLPHGSRADVVRVEPSAHVPAPVCLVRLLATRQGEVLTVPRADGAGLDIPTRRVGTDTPEECVQALQMSALGWVRPSVLLGYVRNIVSDPPDDYPWPAPDAYFGVWQCDLQSDDDVDGQWLDAREAEARLGERHWWPLAAEVLGLADRPG